MAQVVPPYTVRRLVHHRSRSLGSNYYYMPRVSTSWDGGKAAWASNHGYDTGTGVGYADIYVLELAVTNPVPSISSLAPGTVAAGSSGFALTVNGSNFGPNSVVRWNGADRATTVVSSTQLQATIGAGDVATAGTASVRVFSPSPGGGTSSALTFTISIAGNPVPTLGSLSPSSATVEGAAFTLSATGTNFVSGSVVQWNGNARPTTVVSSTQLQATIAAGDLATAGTASVRVFSPSPGGGTSSALTFTISVATNPEPGLSSLAPSTVTAGSPTFTLTVTGTGFVPASKVHWNGTAQSTTFVSTTQLTAVIGAARVATGGTPSVTVVTPAPGGGTSAPQTFTIINPLPALTTVAPGSVTAGSAPFTLTVTGSGFAPTSKVHWNGTARTTTFVSATRLTAKVGAGRVATAGTASVTVVTPTPGGGTSLPQTFTINNPVPGLTTLAPASVTAGSALFTLTVTGTGFGPTSKVYWNGTARTTTFVSATQLTAAIGPARVATAGTASVTVVTPAPGGGTSSPQTLTINNPVPEITLLAPASVIAGSDWFMMTVTGRGFARTSVVHWNGEPRMTTFVSSTQLAAKIPAARVATGGTVAMTVVTPAPGGGTSAEQTFTIYNPVPAFTTLAPNNIVAGGAGFTLTVTGSGFVRASTVHWNGTPRATTFVSESELTATITTADVAAMGLVPVTVVAPTPGGGTSPAQTFRVRRD